MITKLPIFLQDGRKIYGPYSNKNKKRRYVKVIYEDGYSKRESYSHFLIDFITNDSLIKRNLYVKHIDGNIFNNNLDNIRIVCGKSNLLNDKNMLPNIFDTYLQFDEDKYNEIIDLFENVRKIKIK